MEGRMNNDIVAGFDSDLSQSLNLRLQKIEAGDRALLIAAKGYMDTYNSGSFLRRAMMAVEAGFVRLVLDMRGVSFASSTGIGAIVFLLREVASRNGEVILLGLQHTVRDAMDLLGFARYFTIVDDLGQSIAHLAGRPTPRSFPVVFSCPACGKRLRSSRPGRFRCGGCRTVLVIDESTEAKEETT
jgi:anti-sigma B factor antagonist